MGFWKKFRRKAIKVVSGAAGGFLMGGPIGAALGAAAGGLSGGKGKVFKNFALGGAVGFAGGMAATHLGLQNATTTIPYLGKSFTPVSSKVLDWTSGITAASAAKTATAGVNLLGDGKDSLTTPAPSGGGTYNLDFGSPVKTAENAIGEAAQVVERLSGGPEPKKTDWGPLALIGGGLLLLALV